MPCFRVSGRLKWFKLRILGVFSKFTIISCTANDFVRLIKICRIVTRNSINWAKRFPIIGNKFVITTKWRYYYMNVDTPRKLSARVAILSTLASDTLRISDSIVIPRSIFWLLRVIDTTTMRCWCNYRKQSWSSLFAHSAHHVYIKYMMYRSRECYSWKMQKRALRCPIHVNMRAYVGCETVSIPFAFLSERENEKAGKSTLFIDCAPSKWNRMLECNSYANSLSPINKLVSPLFRMNNAHW